jgi:hypothetical protein
METIDNYSDMLGLAERWNGQRWISQSLPVPPGATHQVGLESVILDGVSCVSDTACTAVGRAIYVVNANGLKHVGGEAIAEHWDGTRWSAQTLQVPSLVGSQLNGVSCTTSTVCTAVGYQSVNGGSRVLVERSSGTLPPAPIPASGRAVLTGVPAACVQTSFTVRVTGTHISSVNWLLDGSRVRGRREHRGTRYAASIQLSAESQRHRLTVKVRFTARSHTTPHTFHRNVLSCRTGEPEFTG